MAVTITNQASNLKIDFVHKTEWIAKPFGVSYNKTSKRIYVHPDTKSGQNATRVGIKIPFDDITSPVAASEEDLAELLQAYNNQSKEGTFTNADLSAGVLTITHSLGTTSVAVVIRDPAGLETVQPNTVVDSNTVTVDFGGAIGAGTYTYFVYTK